LKLKEQLEALKKEADDKSQDETCKINSPQYNKFLCIIVACSIVLNHIEHHQGTPLEKMKSIATKDKSVTVRRAFSKICRELGI